MDSQKGAGRDFGSSDCSSAYDIAKKLQQHYDDQFGATAVSIGIASDRFFVYTHRRGLDIVKPDWLAQPIEVKHIGKPKAYRTS